MANLREGIQIELGQVRVYGAPAVIPTGNPANGSLLPIPAKAVIDGAIIVRFV